MPGHFEHLHFQSKKILLVSFGDKEVGLGRLEIEAEAKAAEELGIGNHGLRFRMTADRALKGLLNNSHILNMIDMAVCQDEKA